VRVEKKPAQIQIQNPKMLPCYASQIYLKVQVKNKKGKLANAS
jgi:sRNA-binding carbon storage regulator CsrA